MRLDHQSAQREELAKPIPRRDFEAMDRLNPFAGALAARGIVDENSVYCVTHIVNGEVHVDGTRDESSSGALPDYLQVYFTEDGFDFPQLIQDDYFDAIHLLWNHRKYVSCLMTNLDSRKVRSGRTHRLLPRFTHPDRDTAPWVDGMKVLHVARFVIAVLPEGIENWLRSYNRDRKKFGEFGERYDTIVSEARFAVSDLS